MEQNREECDCEQQGIQKTSTVCVTFPRLTHWFAFHLQCHLAGIILHMTFENIITRDTHLVCGFNKEKITTRVQLLKAQQIFGSHISTNEFKQLTLI